LQAEPARFFYSQLPPYEQTNADGQVDGIGIKVVTSVLNNAGFTPIFELYSIQRGLAALRDDIDFTSIVSVPGALQAEFVFSKLPVYSIKLGVLRLRTTTKLTDLSSLQQHDYVSLRATEFAYLPDAFALSPEFFAKRYKVDTLDDALRLITHGRYAYFLSYNLSSQELKSPFLVFDELLTLPVFLAMSTAHPQVERMMQRIDTAMSKY
jgi:hypothetical protein